MLGEHVQLFPVAAGAAALLCGWWLSVRPSASYRGISASTSFLIVLLAGLMAMLAVVNR